MEHQRPSTEDVVRKGQDLYERSIRSEVETDENIGKLVSIDVETGDYEIGPNGTVEAALRLRERHPDALIYTGRIGYDATYALGGVLERTTR